MSLTEDLDSLLAPYAVKNGSGLGRVHPYQDKAGDERTRFGVDEGRVIHSDAFHRLEKTQVYPHGVPGVHTTSRWPHTMEVAYHSASNAKALRLNDELARVLGLAHDLGHTPFGHEGEDGMRSWMQQHGLTFEHNQQTVRIVTLLMHNAGAYRGLNLNIETIEGLEKHTTRFDAGVQKGRFASLEAQLVDRTDTISWIARDIHDGIQLGILQPEQLRVFPLYERAEAALLQSQREVRSELVHLLCTDVITHARTLLQDANFRSVLVMRMMGNALTDIS